MRATPTATISGGTSSPWRTALKIAAVILFILISGSAGVALGLLKQFHGHANLGQTIWGLGKDTMALIDPRAEFSGQDRVTVLCLGLDRNIFKKKGSVLNGQPYTKGARSDVMMVVSLDLRTHQVSILSIPRDTRVKLAGNRYYSKINDAHAQGGIPLTRQTVEEFLGVKLDYHVVIKQEAIEKVVDALGGVDLKVEKDMEYHDNWGQLHIDLKEGQQRLAGSQVVGYMRFRHDNEGDFGRIRRQQQVIQALTGEVKSPTVLAKAGGLIQAIREYVQTDLSPRQQLALTKLFHGMDQSGVVTAQLPVDETAMIDEVSYVIPDEEKVPFVVDWLIRGNQAAMNRLIRVELKNASGDPELYQQVYRLLRSEGFSVRRAGRASDERDTSHVVQRTNLRGSARRVLDVLGLTGTVEKSEERGSDVTFYVGRDLATSPIVASAPDSEELRERELQQAALDAERAEEREEASSTRRRRRRSSRGSEPRGVEVRIAPSETPQEPQSTEPAMDVPGAADPAPVDGSDSISAPSDDTSSTE